LPPRSETKRFFLKKEAKLLRGCRRVVCDSRARDFLVLFFKRTAFLPVCQLGAFQL
jgi:hypothetical protein